ncbi:hypothetical protein C0991_006642 [Blastosporella zonata]|nr:hypothetical protein C0991_006642 [Blastosporella zonata]
MASNNAQSSSEQHHHLAGHEKSPSHIGFPEKIDFYGQNVATPLSRKHGNAPSSFSESPGSPNSHTTQTGRFTADLLPIVRTETSFATITPKREPSSDHRHALSRSYNPSNSLHYIPWSSSSFAPLPNFMNIQLKSLSPVEFPDSVAFNETLSAFLEGMMIELRETFCIMPDIYNDVYRCLSRGDISKLSPRMREWASYHHLCSGSDNFHLILSPREELYQADDLKREACRQKYCHYVDDVAGQLENLDAFPRTMMDGAELFERLPVFDQIFDILTYAHIDHKDPLEMLTRIRKLGFATITWPMAELYTLLCPVCER